MRQIEYFAAAGSTVSRIFLMSNAQVLMSLIRLILFISPFCMIQAPAMATVFDQESGEQGLQGLPYALKRLSVVTSVMHTIAHPDDENAGLLAWLGRGRHVRTILLTATAGEGGQNRIGTEKGEALGILRSGELISACRYYGAKPYFAGAYDFGYSKSPVETLLFWGHDYILGEFVRGIRKERPDIIIARFAGTPEDGHGHHQAVGKITIEAFHAAADPTRFPEHLQEGLRPWQVKKIYLDDWSGRGQFPENLSRHRIDLSGSDPYSEFTWNELGIKGMQQHISQGMAEIRPQPGTIRTMLHLLDGVHEIPGGSDDLFCGIDTSIMGIAGRIGVGRNDVPVLVRALEQIQEAAGEAWVSFGERNRERVTMHICRGLKELDGLIRGIDAFSLDRVASEELLFYLRWKKRDFNHALQRAINLQVEARADRACVTPGETFTITTAVHNNGPFPIKLNRVALDVPRGWNTENTETNWAILLSGDHVKSENTVMLSADVDYTGSGATSVVEAVINDTEFSLSRVVRAPGINSSRGIQPRDMQVVPPVSVEINPGMMILAPDPEDRDINIAVNISSHVSGNLSGVVQLQAPGGWRVEPELARFDCENAAGQDLVGFHVSIPRDSLSDSALIRAEAILNGQTYDSFLQSIDLDHIGVFHVSRPAESKIQFVELERVAGLRVGYIRGLQDEIPDYLQMVGISCDLLTEVNLEVGNLAEYDVIVAGVRAYLARKDLRSNNDRLMEYVRNGGVYIVQYNKVDDWKPGEYLPYPARMDRNERITDENAPMKILKPGHPVFCQPNKITTADFEGWIQERGLYFLTTWDERYTPLLSGSDPGEDPLMGGLLMAEYGKGLVVYTGLSWFRQLPAGIPGAYRLFANLISLPMTRHSNGPP